MSLDDRLREIVRAIHQKGKTQPMATPYGYVDDLKQAFADEGYVYIPQVEQDKRGAVGTLEGVAILSINGNSNIMTGREWCDRFISELERKSTHTYGEIVKAAKRASGIDK